MPRPFRPSARAAVKSPTPHASGGKEPATMQIFTKALLLPPASDAQAAASRQVRSRVGMLPTGSQA